MRSKSCRHVCEELENRCLLSAVVIRDVNSTLHPFSHSHLVTINGLDYFAIDDNDHNTVWWQTDGTVAGTTPVDGFQPGTPVDAAMVAGKSVYLAENGRLYSMGTPAMQVGAYPVLGPQSSPVFIRTSGGIAAAAASFNGALIFAGSTTAATTGPAQLWAASGGVAFQTAAVNDPADLTPFGGSLYFTADDGVHGRELWEYGSAGTSMVADIQVGNGSALQSWAWLTPFNGALYFAADDGTHGPELWKTDGTAAGTTLVKDINPGATGSTPQSLTVFNGELYFVADDGLHGPALWKSDGTAVGTTLVQDPGLPSAPSPTNLTVSGGKLYFTSGNSLWATDGTQAVKLSDVTASNLTDFNGTLVFDGTDSAGTELWKSDGTPAGTLRLADINPGPAGSSPSGISVLGTRLLFFGSDGTTQGTELWSTDATPAGTVRLGKYDAYAVGLSPTYLAPYSDILLFDGDDGMGHNGLWKTDGTAAGTVFVSPHSIGPVVVSGGLAYFSNGGDLWRTDGSAAGTFMVIPAAEPAATFNGALYIIRTTRDAGTQLWRTDGTLAGSSQITNIQQAPYGGLTSVTPAGNNLFFVDNSHLWRTDGTPQGTVQLEDAAVSYMYPATNGAGIFLLGAGGVWYSDGTRDGTRLVTAADGTKFQSIQPSVASFGGRLYFVADGRLWESDSTNAGTIPANLLPPSSGSISVFAASKNALYLTTSSTDPNGQPVFQLWKSDGASATPLANIDPFWAGTRSFASNGSIDYFMAFDVPDNHPFGVWQTDGTPEGTTFVHPLMLGGQVGEIATVRNTVMFTAEDPAHGQELWEVPPPGPLTPAQPDDLIASAASAYQVNLTWVDSSGNEDGFVLERSSLADFATIDKAWNLPADTTSVNDQSVVPVQTYYYRVRAFNSVGPSVDVSATVTTPPVPARPATLSATPVSGADINLTWTDPAGDHTGFYLDRSRAQDFNQVDAHYAFPASQTGFTDTGLNVDTTYYYRLEAYGPGGSSAPITTAATTPLAPPPPTNLTAGPLAGVSAVDVSLHWQDNGQDETGYRVERSGTADFSTLDFSMTLPPHATRYDDPTAAPLRQYYYRVFAFNSKGNSGTVTVSVKTPALLPGAPSNLVASTISATEIDLSWTPV